MNESDENFSALSRYRLEQAEEAISDAELLLNEARYRATVKHSSNPGYYLENIRVHCMKLTMNVRRTSTHLLQSRYPESVKELYSRVYRLVNGIKDFLKKQG